MRGRGALASALPQASISLATARDSAQMAGPSISRAISCDGFEVLRRRVRIAGFDDVHVQLRQLPGDRDFLAASQAGAGGLFAVSRVVSNTATLSDIGSSSSESAGVPQGADSQTTGLPSLSTHR